MTSNTGRRGPGRPPISEAGEGVTRASILQQAQRLFQERGYSGVAMGDIAAAVGVTKPTLYYHFPHKETLYTEMVVDILSRIGQGVARAIDTHPTAADRLYALAYQGFVYAPRNGKMDTMMRDMEIHLAPADQERIDAAFNRYLMDPLRRIMREGVTAGELRPEDPELLARVWFLLLDAFVGSKGTTDTPLMADRPTLARHLTQLFLEGAAAHPGSGRPLPE
jgi:AcrR family transcriptional regulator